MNGLGPVPTLRFLELKVKMIKEPDALSAFPSAVEQGFEQFTQLQPLLVDTPLVMACRPSEMISMPRFLIRGLRYYIYRDPQAAKKNSNRGGTMASHVIQFRDEENYKQAIMALLEVPVSRVGIPGLKMVVAEEHIEALKRANVDYVDITKRVPNDTTPVQP